MIMCNPVTHTHTQEKTRNFGASHMFVTWLRKLFFSAVFTVVTKNGCVADYITCALGCIKILFFRDVETFILPWIVKNQMKNGLQSYTHQLASKLRQQGVKEGWGRVNRIGSDRARESLESFGSAHGNSKLRNCT